MLLPYQNAVAGAMHSLLFCSWRGAALTWAFFEPEHKSFNLYLGSDALPLDMIAYANRYDLPSSLTIFSQNMLIPIWNIRRLAVQTILDIKHLLDPRSIRLLTHAKYPLQDNGAHTAACCSGCSCHPALSTR